MLVSGQSFRATTTSNDNGHPTNIDGGGTCQPTAVVAVPAVQMVDTATVPDDQLGPEDRPRKKEVQKKQGRTDAVGPPQRVWEPRQESFTVG